jgi:hypothetical protein
MTVFLVTSDKPDIIEKIENVVSIDKWEYQPIVDFYVDTGFGFNHLHERENVISIEVN